MSYRHLRRHQGRGADRRPARGISVKALHDYKSGGGRRQHGGDDRRRLPPQRRGNHRARALPGAYVAWLTNSAPLLLIRLEMRVGDAQPRHRHLGGVGARDQVADDWSASTGAPALMSRIHRGGQRRAFRWSACRRSRVKERPRAAHSRRRSRSRCIRHRMPSMKSLPPGDCQDVPDRRAHQRWWRPRASPGTPISPTSPA